MVITRLTLHNFGVYAGTNTYEFCGRKPIVLIGGMNGRGKTTFLEAVLLALYGPNSFAYSESKYSTYGQYLKSFVNTADGTLEAYVELEFKMDSNSEEKYLVRRYWSGAGQRTREKIFVKKNDEDNAFLTENWAMFIENILPNGLSNFFFFDGEKIAELAVESTNAHMKKSIKTLLGISVLDLLDNDIARIVNRVTKKANDPIANKELETLREKKKQVEVELHAMDEHIAETESQLGATKKKLEKAQLEYSSKGGDILAQRQDLFNQRNQLNAEIARDQENLLSMAASEMPLMLVKDLLQQIQTQAEKEHDTRMLAFAVEKVNTLFRDYRSKLDDRDAISVKKFIQYMDQHAEEESTEIIYGISDQILYQLNSLLKGKLDRIKKNTLMMKDASSKAQQKADELDSYLSVDIDEKELAKIYKKIKTLEQEVIDQEVSLKRDQTKRAALNGEVIRATSEYNKYVEKLLSKLEMNDDGDRILQYAHYARHILEVYKVRLQENKIGVLADTMTQCYKKLANKKNLIDRIEMDAVTLDFTYLNAESQIVPKESLSAGEKQLMVISMLWALAICSKKKLPVIIDTPLSRMDSNHRMALITTYFPNASDQTIILSTDSEIDAHYYEVMKENIGDEFTLDYNDELKCSTIRKGYFIGEKNDH